MSSEPTILLSDDSDKEIIEVSPSSARQGVNTRLSTSRSLASQSNPRQRGRRRLGDNSPSTSTAAQAISINKRRKQDAIIDLTSSPEEEIMIVGALSAAKRQTSRISPANKIVLPPSLPSLPTAKCGICFHNMDDKMSCGPCGHVFCETCLRQAVKLQKKCPTCRRNIQAKQIHRIFLNTSI